MRYSLTVSGEKEDQGYNCKSCDEKKRNIRNCHNRKRLKHTILTGKDEWILVTGKLRCVKKIDSTKFFECPRSAIKLRTWQIMNLVNETTSGEHCDILHLPFPGTILDQPTWYREAVQIIRTERARHQREEMERIRKGK